MKIEDIETIYKKEIKEAEKEFLEGMKNKKNLGELETIYKNKLRLAREDYYESISKVIEKQKESIKKKDKKEDKSEKVKCFKLKPGKFGLTLLQRIKFRLGYLFFKLGFRLRNWLKKITPNILSYNYIKIKITIKRISLYLNNLFLEFSIVIKDNLRKIYSLAKTGIKKLLEIAKKITEATLFRFSKKDSSKEGEEKKNQINSSQNK
ncbi:hypothetical protein BMS3Abin17_00823 [archaeon BMS3Abin17]|nr:hypothetical protein BMS3Abin17_00823 [archaeon BMS3Abin17]HDZ60083.1 hypothetical protein [Candidatus Pacearchaeota archaeon]